MVKHCRSMSVLNCFYLTRKNKDEFINVLKETYKNDNITVADENDKYISLYFELESNPKYSFREMYFYNYWYVEEYNYYGDEIEWNLYSNEDFNKRFKFVTDKEYEDWKELWK